MSYEPTNWKNGDVITAEKLNNMENGIADGSEGSSVFNVNTILNEQNEIVLDKTWQEIYDASKNGALVVISNDSEDEETGYMYSGKIIVWTILYERLAVPEYKLYISHIDNGTQTIVLLGCASNTDFPREWHND